MRGRRGSGRVLVRLGGCNKDRDRDWVAQRLGCAGFGGAGLAAQGLGCAAQGLGCAGLGCARADDGSDG